jgi:glucokinase
VTLLLAGDVGGTKTILSLYSARSDGGLENVAEERFVSADWSGPAAMVRRFLEDSDERPRAACFAVAGPVQDGRVRLTNLAWGDLDEQGLAQSCGIERVAIVNDFAVLVYGLPHLCGHQTAVVRPGTAAPDSPVLLLGAGTGLGVAIGVPGPAGWLALASEAGHTAFPPRSAREWELAEWLRADLGLERVSLERVVSGTGLGHVARWLLDRDPAGADHPLRPIARRWRGAEGEEDSAADLPAAVAAAAEDGDPLARSALDLWLGAYGAATGDLALTCLPRGGIWLAGGTAAKQLENLRSDRFLEPFLAKGRLRPVLEPMPVTAIVDPAIGSFSAACRARLLLD